MRYVCSAAAAVIASIILAPSIALGQAGSPDLSITNYQFVGEQRFTRTQWYTTYRADIVNRGGSPVAVTATVTSLTPTVEVVAGQGTLHFPVAPPNGQVTSLDTFTLLVDRSVLFDFANLRWSFLNPVANAGPNQTATVGTMVTLNGSGSSNPSGVGNLTYNWAFNSRPASSTAALSFSTGVMTTFVVDVPGTYVVTLTVSNGVASDSAKVTISTVNSPPVANPGPNQTVGVGSTVTLNGSGSSDVDGDPLTHLWSLVTQPGGSSAALSNARSPVATFVADKAGTYAAQLIVNDGKVNSAPATVSVTTANTPPVANAGPNQNVNLGALVQLNGAGSTDVDGDPLTFKWIFNSIPNGSAAVLSNVSAVNPTFTADRLGTYVAQLIVNDGKVDSAASTVTITTNAVQAPVANAGPNQTVVHGTTVTLNGSGTDPQGLPLTLTWSLSTRPPDSTAALSATNGPHPTFFADKPGLYIAQLIVSNGYLVSQPVTVTITTTNTPPVAIAGQSQNVAVGVTVYLDGSASSDSDNDPLTYSWSLSRPPSSNTVLQGAVTKTPSFFADMPGTYVAQLIVTDGFTNSSPATVMITASLMKVTLSPNPLNLQNAPQTLTITLSAPAGAGGVPVTLSGFDPSIISLPSGVIVPENSTGSNVTVTPLAAGSTNILASAPGYQPGTAAVTVTTPAITVSLSFTAVGLTRSLNGTITLSAPAPAGGAVIALSSSPVGRVTFDPANVTIPAGSTTGTFKVIGGTEGTATITAAAAGYISGTASVLVVNLGGILLPTDLTVPPGQSAALNVRLSTPAPVDGVTVALVSGDGSILSVSPSVFIAQGATTPVTPAQVNGIKFGSTTVTASAGGYTGDSQTVKVAGTLSFSPQAVTVGAAGDQSVSILLSAPAPAGGLSVALQSSNTAVATVPPSVVINSNATSADVLLRGVAPGSATITASTTTPNVSPGTLPVTVAVFGSISLPSNVTVGQGQSVAFPITLSAPAPPNGVTVALSTSNSSTVDILPKSVTILAGQTQPASQPQVIGNGLGQATITASAGGYGSTSQPVQGNTTLSFAPQNLTITGAETKDLTLTLAIPAPSGGVTVNITASPAGVVTVPASVPIAQNTTTATVHVTGVAAGTATIAAAATSPNIGNATATVTVQNAGAISLPTNVTVGPGQSLPFAVTLTSPAPQGGVTVALSTGDSTKVSIAPASVSIDAGQVQPATQPQVTGGEFGSAVITASAPGYTTANQSVTVGASLSFSPADYTIIGPDTENITLTLSAPAPSVVSVNLSASSAGVVTMPQTVTIAQHATTATVTLKGASAGATTITAASSTPNVSNATCNITVQSAGAIGLPSNVTVGLGQTVAFQVTLPAPAPQGGVTVTLSSDTPKVGIIPASVTIDTGQTQPAVAPPLVMGKDPGTTNITASAPVYTSTTKAVQVTATISFSPPSLTLSGTETQNLTLTLSGPAPSGGLTFNVSSSNTSVATVGSPAATIQPGATTATIPVSGVAAGSAVIRASAPNLTDATANVTVNTAVDIIVPASVSVSPGESVPFPISLGRAAQSLLFLELTSSDPTKATVSPASITIAAGQTQSTTQVRVYGVATGTTTIKVKPVIGGLAEATSAVTVGYTLSIVPANLTILGNGNSGILNLTLSGPAPAGGIDLTLTSSNPSVATVPPSLTLSPTTSSIGVRVMSVAAGTAVIHVSGPNVPEATANVTVLPPGSVGLSGPASIVLSQTGTLTVTLSSPATGNGVSVDLTSSDASRVSVSPSTVTIPPGATTPVNQPQLNAVNVGSASITASAAGFTPPAPLVVQVNATITWVSQNTIIVGIGNQALLQLRLNAMAPVAGLTVNMTSSNPAVATVQGVSNFIWDGSTSPGILIPVTAIALGTVIIHASGINIPDVTTTVTVAGPLEITTASLPNGNLGSAYSGAVAAAGGMPPYAWTATGLPAGLAMNPATGAITGTPTQAGPATVNVTVTDAASPTPSSVSKQFPVTITSALVITTAALPNGVVGSPYNGAVTETGGTPPFTWAATGLPAGLSIGPTTGTITGTPSAAGAATINVTVTDATLPTHLSASKQFPVTIAPTLTITTASLPNGVVGSPYNGPVAATGGTPPYAWAATGVPAGLSIDPATGAITGTPSAAGAATINVTVTDATLPTHVSVSKQFPVTIVTTVTITTASLPDGVVGAPYNSGPLSAAGGTPSYTWAATGLPAGLSIDPSTGAITGTPSTAGAATISVTVTDATTPTHLTANKQFPVTIGAGLTITTASLPNGVVGTAYSGPVAAAGGTTPYAWTATGLPAGLSIDPSTGAITGMPTAAGAATISVTVTDATSPTRLSANKQFPVTILAPLSITTTSLPNGVVGTAYSGPVAATGGTTPYAWTATGLPAGLSIDPNTGAITGTPTATGASTISVTVTDATGPTHLSANKQFPVTIIALLSITTTSLPNGVVGTAYSGPVAATGGTTPYAWTATGLPAGLSIDPNTGAITGTPTSAGAATISVTVTDATTPTHLSANKQFPVTIIAALAITTTSLPNGQVGTAYSGPVAATGGTTPYAWTATGLPAGLSIDPNTGAITGTPTASGPATISVTVTDATTPTQLSANKSFPVTIAAGLLTITTPSLPGGQVGTAYTQTVVATGGTAPFHWSATGLPAGLTINTSTGQITGTPTAAGTSSVNFTVTDTETTVQTANKTLSITIQSLTITTTSLPAGLAFSPYSYQLTATGGVTPFIWSVNVVPRGMTFDPNTGILGGIPNNAGSYPLSFSVSDSSTPPQTATKDLALTIQSIPLSITSTSPLPDGLLNTAYTPTTLIAAGGSLPYLWSATGLPAGLLLSSSGTISGTPTVAGLSSVVVTVMDSSSPTPQQVPKTFSLNVNLQIGGGVITVTSATVGVNLQMPITITFTPPLPSAATVTVTSGTPALVTFGSGGVAGSGEIQATLAAGTGSISTFVQAFGSSGQVTITVSLPGYTTGTGTVTLANSGFVVAGANGIGAAISTYMGVTSTLTVYAALLDNSGLFVQSQQIRGGYSINVPLSSTVTTVGNVGSPAVVFSGGMDSTTATFTANSTNMGVTNVVVGPAPSPFSQPAAGAFLVVTVNSSGLIPFSATIGKNLQTNVYVSRTGSTSSSAVVTVHSQDASRLKFSTTPTGATSATITVTIPPGQNSSPDFYAHVFDSSGTVAYTISSPGYGSVDSTVSLAPSGLVIYSPAGAGADFTMSLGTLDAMLYVYTAWLSGSSPAGFQAVASGVTITGTVTVDTSAIGNITVPGFTINGGSSSALSGFHATAVGGPAHITASASGYASGSVAVTVSSSYLIVSDGLTIGQYLQDTGQVILTAPAPAGGLHVTLQSNSPSLKLATTPTGAGLATIGLDIAAGSQVSAPYHIQSLGSAGTATYTATASGYSPGNGSVDLVPSGIVITGPSVVNLSAGAQMLTVFTAQLNSSNAPVTPQPLAGGGQLVVSLLNSPGAAGTVPSSVAIAPGTSSSTVTFMPVAAGSTTVSVVQPNGWTLPTGLTSVGILVQ